MTPDPRVLRAAKITGLLSIDNARRLESERRALLRELRDEGAMTMAALARAVGVSRQRLYDLLGPLDPETHRQGVGSRPGAARGETVERREHYEPPAPVNQTRATTAGRRYSVSAARAKLDLPKGGG